MFASSRLSAMPMSSLMSAPCEATPVKRASCLRPPAPASGAKLAAPCWLMRARAAAATCASERWPS
eukprot:3033654-Alexandrium_andersonii.AAC.1